MGLGGEQQVQDRACLLVQKVVPAATIGTGQLETPEVGSSSEDLMSRKCFQACLSCVYARTKFDVILKSLACACAYEH